MIKHLKILDYALSSLWRRRYKNLAIIAVFAFTVAVLGSVLLLTQALKVEAEKILAHAPELIIQKIAGGRHDMIPEEYRTKIAGIPGIGEVKPRTWGYYYDGLTGGNYTLIGFDSLDQAMPLLAGRMPETEDECALGSGLAAIRNVGPGDEVIFINNNNMGTIFEITGVFKPESNLLANDLIVLTQTALRDFLALPEGMATDLAVQVYNKNEVGTAATKIKKLLPDTRPITRAEILRTYNAVFNWRSGMMLALFASALAAFCVLAWDKATGISGEEKREIAVLKAIGWDTGDVLELKFWEGLAVSLTSLLTGLLLAFVHVFIFKAGILTPMLKGWSVMFPDFIVPPHIDLYQIFVIAFLTVTPYVVCTIVPSWKTAVTDPESVMRS